MKKGLDKVEELDIAAGRYINKTLSPVDEFIIRARDKLKYYSNHYFKDHSQGV